MTAAISSGAVWGPAAFVVSLVLVLAVDRRETRRERRDRRWARKHPLRLP